MDNKIDINNSRYYEFGKPELKERTKNRLKQLADLGMQETGIESFGIKGIMSGMYIEKVWSYSDDDFNDYINWTKELIKEKTTNNETI